MKRQRPDGTAGRAQRGHQALGQLACRLAGE
jgi:hypothetical protein